MENKWKLFEDVIASTMNSKYYNLIDEELSDRIIEKVWEDKNINYNQHLSILYAVEKKYKD
jgi:hypothetical protein